MVATYANKEQREFSPCKGRGCLCPPSLVCALINGLIWISRMH